MLCLVYPTLLEKCPNTDFFSGPCFHAFGLNTEIHGLNIRIQSKLGKMRTRKNSVFKQFLRCAIFGMDLQTITYLFAQNIQNDSKTMVRTSV